MKKHVSFQIGLRWPIYVSRQKFTPPDAGRTRIELREREHLVLDRLAPARLELLRCRIGLVHGLPVRVYAGPRGRARTGLDRVCVRRVLR